MKLYHLVEWYGFGIASATDIWQPIIGIIHLVCSQNFSKKYYFLPPDMYMHVCVSEGEKC